VIDPGVLASRLRRARLALGLTQQALADAAGVGHATVERLERAAGDDAVQLALVDCGLDLLPPVDDRANPCLDTLEALARALGVTTADLVLDGPELLDLAWALSPGRDLGSLATLEARLGEALADALGVATVSVWPWLEPSTLPGPVVTSTRSRLTVRLTGGLVPLAAALAGTTLAVGSGLPLGAPSITAVRPAGSLRVLVSARSDEVARSWVRSCTTSAGCCPAITLDTIRPLESGRGWVAALEAVPARASVSLQALRATAGAGLFVPARVG
jgi:DNA-binding XRE family transcriptional regulator